MSEVLPGYGTYDAARQLAGERRGGKSCYRHTFTYDAANQLRHTLGDSARTAFTFDANGNQQVTRDPNGDRTTNVWDYENKLALTQLPSGARVTALYNPDGLRVDEDS
jgi:YD repeat-containing protein